MMAELLEGGLLDGSPLTVSGKSVSDNLAGKRSEEVDVIKTVSEPLRPTAGFQVVRGNLFNSALLKTSVISEEFRQRFLQDPDKPGVLEARAIVFEGPEDYHERINDESLQIDERTIYFQ